MPLLENDGIFAYPNQEGPKHVVAEGIFRRLKEGEARFEVSNVSLLEIELIYRSEKREGELFRVLAALAALPNTT